MQQGTEASVTLFRDQKPVLIRVWHWLAAVFFGGAITTVIFGEGLFDARENISMVQEQASRKGGSVTQDQAWAIAHEFGDKVWMLHKYIGFGLAALLLFRVIIRFAEPGIEKNLGGLRKAFEINKQSPETKHYLLVQYGYRIFYTMFVVMATTGLVLAFEDVRWLQPVHDPAREIHEFTQWGMYGYTLLHIVGVIKADIGQYGGIISRMINGKP